MPDPEVPVPLTAPGPAWDVTTDPANPQPLVILPTTTASITAAPCRLCGGTGERRWLQCEQREYAQPGQLALGVAVCWRCGGTGRVPALAIVAEGSVFDG